MPQVSLDTVPLAVLSSESFRVVATLASDLAPRHHPSERYWAALPVGGRPWRRRDLQRQSKSQNCRHITTTYTPSIEFHTFMAHPQTPANDASRVAPLPPPALIAPLRGRETILARLEGLLVPARAGAGGVVVLEGTAGIGKSRLLAEVQARAEAAGVAVAAGGADELDQVTPWAPLLAAFGSGTRSVLAADSMRALHAMADRRLAVIEQMQAALEEAASAGPLLVVLDDMQWADAATVMALGSLPLSLFSYPVKWLLALRPVPASPALEGMLERLDEAGALRVHLDPLSVPDAITLARDAGATGSDAEVAGLIAGAAGNPFYISQLLKTGADSDSGAPARQVQDAIRAAVTRHLRSLSRDARQLLQVASVLGRQFSVAEVAALTGHPSSRLLDAVHEALRAELLVEVPAGLAFRHDLLRHAVYHSLSVSMRAALHRDAARALRATGAPVVRVAGQLAIGALPGDEGAVAYMEQAVGELTASSPGAAADLALRALELAGHEYEGMPELVLTAVRALGAAGRSEQAGSVFEEYLNQHRPSSAVEAELRMQVIQARLADSNSPYSRPLPGHLLADPAVDPAVRATLMALDQVPGMWLGRTARTDQLLEQAILAVTQRGRTDELIALNQWRVQASLHRGDCGEAVTRARAVLDAALSPGTEQGSGVPGEMLVTALAADGRIAEALEKMRDGLAEAREAGRAGLMFRYLRLRAAMLLSQGDLENADGEARSAIDMPGRLGYPHRTALPVSVMVAVAIRRGALTEARSAVARYRPAPGSVLPDFHWADALAADASGDSAAAERALAPIRRQLEAGIFYIVTTQHHRLPQLVRISLSAGQRQSAATFARAAVALGEQNPHSDTLAGAAAHALALLDDDPDLLREAVKRAAAGDDRLLEAAAREDLGRVLGTRSAAEAVAHLESAYDFYAQIGADRDTARTRSALRALGVSKRQPGPARPRDGWASLTASEQRVAELAARGLTNREVAGELFLSPYTINTHLRHVFTKLGIRSRVELARLLAERHLALGKQDPGQV
jgi:DNA-binding NarL/FixJ family response regulator